MSFDERLLQRYIDAQPRRREIERDVFRRVCTLGLVASVVIIAVGLIILVAGLPIWLLVVWYVGGATLFVVQAFVIAKQGWDAIDRLYR